MILDQLAAVGLERAADPDSMLLKIGPSLASSEIDVAIEALRAVEAEGPEIPVGIFEDDVLENREAQRDMRSPAGIGAGDPGAQPPGPASPPGMMPGKICSPSEVRAP